MSLTTKWQPIRENLRLRVYLRDKTEVHELRSEYEGKPLIEFATELPLGDSAADFVYEDFEHYYQTMRESEQAFKRINAGEAAERIWQGLLGSLEYAAERHPYFAYARMVLYSLYFGDATRIAEGKKLNTQALSSLVPAYKAMREDLFALISGCLNVEDGEQATPLARYQEADQEGKFTIPDGLTYAQVRADVVSAMQILALNDDNGLPIVSAPSEASLIQSGSGELREVLYPASLADLCRYLKAQYLMRDVKFKPCKSCGRFFAVLGNSKAEYCNRQIVGSKKTCRQIGAVRLYQNKRLENPAIRAYTKAYKTRNARIRYGSMTKEQFSAWAVEARRMRDLCVSGEIELAELEEWLGRED